MTRLPMRCYFIRLALALVCVTSPSSVGSDPGGQIAGQPRDMPPARFGAAMPQSGMDGRLARLEQWLKAVMRHEPGTTDAAALLVSSWSHRELRALWIDANAVIQLMRSPKESFITVQSEGQRKRQEITYAAAQFHRLRVLACAAGGLVGAGGFDEPVCVRIGATKEFDDDLRRLASLAGASERGDDDNYILRRGALLHADVAMLLPVATGPVGTQREAGPERIRMRLSDGREVDLHQVGVHWELARMLLDYVKPSGTDRPAPGRDDMVRAWYRATAAWMQSREDYDTVHLARARALFPTDPDILFLSGCQDETYAAPAIQNVVGNAILPPGVMFSVDSKRAELRQAEVFLRRAAAGNPAAAEAHLRLGRVLSLLERHAEASNELRQAQASTEDRATRYYAQLFLGAAEEGQGHFDTARAAYGEAAALFPTAQSPHLALSALAKRRGDRDAALREIQRMFALASTESLSDDPWWIYHTVQARNADELLVALRKPFLPTISQ